VDLIHAAGKKAMMFYCDHHIGAEPYGPHFKKMGLDGIVNPCGSGSEVRRIADIPVDMLKEIRLYPYFFPLGLWGEPIFAEGGNPREECRRPWMNVRRALAQRLVDRIGFGGYPSLAAKYPDFVEYVAHLSDEFRSLHDNSRKTAPYRPSFKVGVLNAWGRMRSWLGGPFTGGALEALSGMSVDVEFLNFRDLLKGGVPEGVRVLVNMGEADTSWSGGRHWTDERVLKILRDWLYSRGGGIVGIGEPTAFLNQGSLFQLADVFGLDRKQAQSMNTRNPVAETAKDHFILEDQPGPVKLGSIKDRVYLVGDSAQVLAQQQVRVTPGPLQEGGDVYLAANRPGRGRAVYLAGLDYNPLNARLLLRALYWAAAREKEMKRWFSANPYTECVAYPQTGKFLVLNNRNEEQETIVFDGEGKERPVSLKPAQSKWFDI
jgi:1,3-beta-galactosyl-N-acetylhexosamine phosphorylase